MSDKLRIVPVSEWTLRADSNISNIPERSRIMAANDIPACVLGRSGKLGIDSLSELCREFLRYEILPVCRLNLSDSSPEIRNLSEFCSLGIINLSPGPDIDKIPGLIDLTGRHRLLTDIEISFGDSVFSDDETEKLIRGLNRFAKKYGHIQRVKLISPGTEKTDSSIAVAAIEQFFKIARSCPKAIISASPEFRMSRAGVRESIADLGCVSVFTGNEFESDSSSPKKPDPLFAFAQKEGLAIERALPVSYPYYRKGWYSFEVGKVLDSWADRSSFRYYKEPYAWL